LLKNEWPKGTVSIEYTGWAKLNDTSLAYVFACINLTHRLIFGTNKLHNSIGKEMPLFISIYLNNTPTEAEKVSLHSRKCMFAILTQLL